MRREVLGSRSYTYKLYQLISKLYLRHEISQTSSLNFRHPRLLLRKPFLVYAIYILVIYTYHYIIIRTSLTWSKDNIFCLSLDLN